MPNSRPAYSKLQKSRQEVCSSQGWENMGVVVMGSDSSDKKDVIVEEQVQSIQGPSGLQEEKEQLEHLQGRAEGRLLGQEQEAVPCLH